MRAEPEQRHGRRRFVLVTGMPRSGTTGVGSALGHAPGSAYFYEPLNPETGLTSVKEYFVFPGDDTLPLDATLQRVFRVDLRLRRGIWDDDPRWKKLAKNVTGTRSRASAVRIRVDPRVRTVIWKDPFASFLVPTLRERYGVPAVVTVRPPGASAASFKRLGWHFDLERVHRLLSGLAPGADFLRREPAWVDWSHDPTMTGALLWRMIYGYLDHALPAATGPDDSGESGDGLPPVLWANSRTLLEQPEATYAGMYDALGLPLTDAARAAIARDYADEGTSEPDAAKTHDRHRNVQQANSYWSKTLSPEEQAAVATATAPEVERLERRTGPLS